MPSAMKPRSMQEIVNTMKLIKTDKSPEELSASISDIIASITPNYVRPKKQRFVIKDKITYDKEDRKKYPRLFKTWRNMHQRCSGARSEGQHYYENIFVCQAWHDFKWFLTWALSHGYHHKLTLDRIDPEDNYRPSNCRFATKTTQSRNTRRKVMVEYAGKEWLLIELCEQFDMPYNAVYCRIFVYNWTIEDALNTPIKTR